MQVLYRPIPQLVATAARRAVPCTVIVRASRYRPVGWRQLSAVCCAVESDERVAVPAAQGNIPEPAPNVLYVCKLPEGVSEAQLSELFSTQPGVQQVTLVHNPERGRDTINIGYVTFDTAEAAAAAQKALLGSELGGNRVKLGRHLRTATQPPPGSKQSSNSDDANSHSSDSDTNKRVTHSSKLYQQPNTALVTNLAWATMSEDLQQHFEGCDGVVDAFITYNKDNKPSGWGFVRFESAEAAEAAVKALHGSDLDGREISVRLARPGRIDTTDSGSVGSNSADGDDGFSGATATETRITVKNLPQSFTWREVWGMCSVFGEVRRVNLYDKGAASKVTADDGAEAAAATAEGAEVADLQASDEVCNQQATAGQRGRAAIAYMGDRQAAEQAVVTLNGLVVQGSALSVRLYRDSKRFRKKRSNSAI
eukprot:GHRR01001947.1.p1 GENE.GHRR01001947.1~~GHRR01001947.1.p1  ORF type:complete len:424 (+),score=154.57 GHRR01001947.1:182-1453(+)